MVTQHTPTDLDISRGMRLARNLREEHIHEKDAPELFDNAESNMDMNFNKNDIDFPDTLETIQESLEDLRRNQDDEQPLINDQIKISALNTYIENAMIIAKKNNMLELSNWDEMSDLSNMTHSSHERRERELLETSLSKLNRIKRDNGARRRYGMARPEIVNQGPGQDYMKSEGLLELAKKGELFDINIGDIYKQVGKKQVQNFARLYGVHRV